nr:hypothetical protein [Brevundimonas naejangsanensis]
MALTLGVGALALAGTTVALGLARLNAEEPPVLSAQSGKGERTAAAADARSVLLREPLSARAYSRLGQISVLDGDTGEADLLMQAAARRSLRDGPSQVWIFARALERGDHKAAAQAFDILMRRRPDLFDALAPAAMAALDQNPNARTAMAERLALEPAWRGRFLGAYVQKAATAQHAYDVLQQLRRAPASPSDAEMRSYIDRLLAERAYVAAYVAWAQHHSLQDATDDGVSDGGFEEEPALPPFGWTFKVGDGAAAQRGPATNGAGWVLQASVAGGLSRRTLAQQMMVLSPGVYQLSGRAWTRAGDAESRFVWSIRCVGGAERASMTEGRSSPGRWRTFVVDFEIPATGCDAQTLALQARPGASLAPAEVDYDQLVVARKEAR